MDERIEEEANNKKLLICLGPVSFNTTLLGKLVVVSSPMLPTVFTPLLFNDQQ